MSLRFLRKNQVEQFIHKRRALILQVYFSWYWKSIHASRWGIRSIDYGPKWQTYTPPKFAFATPKKRKQMVWLEFTLLLLFYPSPPLILFSHLHLHSSLPRSHNAHLIIQYFFSHGYYWSVFFTLVTYKLQIMIHYP